MKALKLVKFLKAPGIQSWKLEQQEMEEETFAEFETNRELKEFDLSSVENWMPYPPRYKGYCALRDPQKWKSVEDIDRDQSSGWGVDARNDVKWFNEPHNKKRT